MKQKQSLRSVLLHLVPIALVLILQLSGILSLVEASLSDRLYQQGGTVANNVFVIGIDEDTLSAYGSFDTWSREKTAELIELLTADPDKAPKVIAVDIGFYGEKDAETDDRLVKAVENAGNVVLVSTASFGTVISDNDTGFSARDEVVLLEEPFEALRDAAVAVGHANVNLDEDGVARHALGDLEYEGKTISSFAYEVASLLGVSGDFGTERFYIDYSGLPRDYYGTAGAGASFRRVLEGEYPVSAFQNAVVFIGAYASGMQDSYYTPVDKESQMYGVEIHANILVQLLNAVEKQELSDFTGALVTLVVGALALALLLFVDIRFSAPGTAVLAVLYVFGVRFAYKGGVLLPVLFPVLAVVLVILTRILYRYFAVHREKKRIIASYGRYLSPEVAATIAETGEEALRLGGTKKDIAVLFVDIRSFTTLSESLPPERVVAMLNQYLSVTTGAIFSQKGTVDKFIGDATMGVFNAPLDLPDYTFRAVCAGLEMAKRSAALQNDLPEDLRGRVGFGVGIHCGEAVVGNIGTEFRMEYTAIGDTVNTASRLEGQAKASEVIVSQAVYERLKDRIVFEDRGDVKLKGKAEPVRIYRAVEVMEGKTE